VFSAAKRLKALNLNFTSSEQVKFLKLPNKSKAEALQETTVSYHAVQWDEHHLHQGPKQFYII